MTKLLSEFAVALRSMFGIAGAAWRSNVVRVEQDDLRLRAAIDEARSTVASFIEALAHPAPDTSGFAVKVPVQAGPKSEHLWLNEVISDGEHFHGVVNNLPMRGTGLKMGDMLSTRAGPST